MKGLVARLLLLVSLALLPVLAFEIYVERDARQVRQHLVEEEALRLVRLVASEQQRIVEGAEQALTAIGAAPSLQNFDLAMCHQLLATLVERSPRYSGAALFGLDGHVICTSNESNPGVNVAGRDYVRMALQTGHLAMGSYAVGLNRAEPTIHVAAPFRTTDGRLAGVAGLALSLDWLGEGLGHLPMPQGTVVEIKDRNGIILARSPPEPARIGALTSEPTRITLVGDKVGITETTSRDGVARLIAYSPPAAEPKGLAIVVGLDRETMFGAVTRANRAGSLLIVAGAALALLITALLGGRLIRKPVRRLLGAAERWRQGELAARSGLPADSSEFGRLGAAFDAMATALAARQHALSTALESTTDNVLVLDRDWRITFLNERAKAAIARDRDMVGQVLWDVIPGLLTHSVGAALRTAMEQGTPTYASGYSPTFGRDFEVHAYPSSDGVTAFFRDVTQERRMAAALLESEQLFRATFEQAAVGMVQYAMDGTVLRVNDRLCNILDRSRESLTGRLWQEFTHPDDLAGFIEARQALLDGRATSVSGEKRFLRHDGTAVWTNVTTSLLRDADGKPDRILAVIEDISERKRFELALKESEALLRAVLEQIPAALSISTLPGGIVTLRSRYSETVLGTERTLPAPVVHSSEHPDGSPYAAESYPSWRALYRGETVIAEPMLYRRPDGALMELEVYAAPVRNPEGRIVAAVAAAFDMTERNAARRVLAQSNAELEARVRREVAAREAAQDRAAQAERMQALGRLAGGIAHDFNNVLQAIEGGAALIESRPHDEGAVRRLARQVREAVGRGASITRRLLAVGRGGDLRSEAVEVTGMLTGMREILAHTLGAEIDVKVRLANDIPPILADKGQLETALVNLATNARDAMPDGGVLTIAAAAEKVVAEGAVHPLGLGPGSYVRLTVTDTGTGMEAGTLARATEPFFTTKPIGSGTGLGLAMVRGFVEQSGGALAIDSSPGKGTTVVLFLPAADAPAAPAPPQLEEEVHAALRGAATTRVLLVDDEDELREILAEQLDGAGYSTLVAATGAEALALLKAGEAVDILVTDLSMPGMDGLAVIRAAQEAHPGLPAVLLTGYAGDGAAIAVGRAVTGPFTLLRKPIRLHELTDRLQALLAARQGRPGALPLDPAKGREAL